MSKQALDAFKAKLAQDGKFRNEMTDVLSGGGSKQTATVNELVDFATAHGYAFTTDEACASVELGDGQLDGVSGGGPQPHLSHAIGGDTLLPLESLSLNFTRI